MEKTVENKKFRLMSVVYLHDIKDLEKEFRNFPLYRIVEDCVIEYSLGVKHHKNDAYFYDVTNASQEFHEKYEGLIKEIGFHTILNEKSINANDTLNSKKIINVIPLTGIYSSLSQKEKIMLGHDFVNIENVGKYFKVTPLLVMNGLNSNYYLNIHTDKISDELKNIISADLKELVTTENGLYMDSDDIIKLDNKM